MFGCLRRDEHHKLFKKKAVHHFDVNLFIKENHLVFTLKGSSDLVSKNFYHILQTVQKIDYYQVESHPPQNKINQSCYYLGIQLSNKASLTNMFWFLKNINQDTVNLIEGLSGHEKLDIKGCYEAAKQITKPLPAYIEPIKRESNRYRK